MSDELAIPAMAMSIPLVVVPTALFFKHLGRRREMLHRERMRAIEMGQPPQGPASLVWPSLAALAIGAGVPICALLFAFLSARDDGGHKDTWIAAMMVGVAGVVGGVSLAVKMIDHANKSLAKSPEKPTPPHYDYDAYDTVSSRG
jgi:hypothetical protein